MLDGQPLGEYPELSSPRWIYSPNDVEGMRRHLSDLWAVAEALDGAPMRIRRGPHC